MKAFVPIIPGRAPNQGKAKMQFGYWIAKILGAFAGSAFSLAFMAPETKREAINRMGCGVFVGTIFGGAAVDWIEKQLDISIGTDIERAIAGAFIASFVAWYVLGVVYRFLSNAKTPRELKKGE